MSRSSDPTDPSSPGWCPECAGHRTVRVFRAGRAVSLPCPACNVVVPLRRTEREAADSVAMTSGIAIAPEAAEAIARLFHDMYERLAPAFGYRTREASAVPWDDVPQANRDLMTATVGGVLEALSDAIWPARYVIGLPVPDDAP